MNPFRLVVDPSNPLKFTVTYNGTAVIAIEFNKDTPEWLKAGVPKAIDMLKMFKPKGA